MRPAGELRARFRDGKAARLARFIAARPTARAALRLVRALARDVDVTVVELWRQAQMPADAALVAVGGYGRGELFPCSDVDVLVLLPDGDNDDGTRGAAAERFIVACWDAGLEIGSSVRTRRSAARAVARAAMKRASRAALASRKRARNSPGGRTAAFSDGPSPVATAVATGTRSLAPTTPPLRAVRTPAAVASRPRRSAPRSRCR